MESVGATGNADKGGLDFSLANLCRCMCFTHEDTAATDSKVRSISDQYASETKDRTPLIPLSLKEICTLIFRLNL